PVTAHGFNLGILSVKHLAKRVINAHRRGQDFSTPHVLRAYTREHRLSSLPLFAATNFIVSLYTNDRARLPRQALLQIANKVVPFKKLVATRLTGGYPNCSDTAYLPPPSSSSCVAYPNK